MAAYRLGRKLERFRLAARLSEGRASKPVRATLDGLIPFLIQKANI
jgi:hypothetical protein